MKNLFHIFAVLFFISLPAHASETPIGQIVATQGTVVLENQDTRSESKPGDNIYLGTTVLTGEGARALIILVDDTEISLGESTELEIDQYIFDPKAPPANNRGNITIKGAFLWASGLLAKDNKNVNIHTNVGSIGIRGTTVWGGTLDENHQIFVADGAVSYSTNVGRITIAKGKGIAVKNERSSFELKTWPEEKINRAVATISFPEGTDLDSVRKKTLEQNAAERAK